MKGFKKFPSIGTISDASYYASGLTVPTIMYSAKVKLHGTNGCVRISANKEVVAQSRTTDITQGTNFGFEKWVEETRSYWETFSLWAPTEEYDFYIYGEWAGPGVQQHDAVSQIDKPSFFVFAIYREGEGWEFDPDVLRRAILHSADVDAPDNLYVIPWHIEGEIADLSDPEGVREFLDVNDTIGKGDPYMSRFFGIEGPGEGLVYYPLDGYREDWNFFFKVKVDRHNVVARKKLPKKNLEPSAEEKAFVEAYVTPARMEQAASEVSGGERLRKQDIGEIIRWVSTDVHKESVRDLEKMGIKWKRVSRQVNQAAANCARRLVGV